MSLVCINDTLKNSPIKENRHIIYSISWHPKEMKIALVGSQGIVMIYNALKSKLLSSLPLSKQSQSSYKVEWN